MNRPFSIRPEAALAANRSPYFGHGKIEMLPKVLVGDLDDVATLYTPGVAYSVREIMDHPEALHELTSKDNTVGVVTDGTAVLGWGRTGPHAAVPVMEGKAAMFKLLTGIDAIPLCLNVADGDDLVHTIKALEPGFGGFNLEDVSAPTCFSVMQRLDAELSVPCIHDDQYGTATVAMAALINAWKVLGRSAAQQRVVINGAGAAGSAVFDLLLGLGVRDIIVHERDGILCEGRSCATEHHRRIAAASNHGRITGGLTEAIRGATAFIGVSVAAQLTADMVRTMAPAPVILALANPIPEIMPEEAIAGGAAIIGTGRFDYVNQCNNVLAFPALMRGALDTRAKRLTRDVYLAAAAAIAGDVPDHELSEQNILPTPLSETLYPRVSEVTARAIVDAGLARRDPGVGVVEAETRRLRSLVAKRQHVLSELGALRPSQQ
ncbi:NADP-dependent malic enzyme [Pseudaminobacter sp. 19-2017]|uniref:NADP-dependent malic enzyme n=1 Tax=Pseudaminobacter soli (ex Zhang et al. 2022) TaxID=2831468 RepID=A0A942E1R5_9HYPH|nr:NADP-dependent malic enzyme [Pseudaminobacter soli]MBS3652184.1 NADP-dependent malic enzyme [Pseudaminobacter soli]